MRRRGIQVGHSLNMIAELPHYAHDRDVPVALRAAALDAFWYGAVAWLSASTHGAMVCQYAWLCSCNGHSIAPPNIPFWEPNSPI